MGPGGRPGPVVVCDTPQPPPPPRVLRDSGLGAWHQRRPPFFSHGTNDTPFFWCMLPFHQTINAF